MSYSPGAPVISTNNATTATLAGGATYTGTWERAPRSMVLIQTYSDVAGTLYLDFSTDGSNKDSTYPANGVPALAATPLVYPAATGGRWFRVRYINGSSAQSVFRLEATFSEFTNFYAALNSAVNLSAPAIMTRSAPEWLDISRSLMTGITVVKKFGRYGAVGTSFTPIARLGIYNTPQAASATTLRIKAGGDANDTAAGSGAREVTLIGLDENWNEVTEAVATAGASASSATTTTFTRLYRAYVSASGTYATASAGSHAATITIENGAGGTDWAEIDATDFPLSQTEIGAYSIPTGYTGYVFLDDVCVETNGKTADVAFFWRAANDDTAAPYSAMRVQTTLYGLTQGISSLEGRRIPFGPFTGPCDIGFMGKVDATTGGISCEFEIHLVNE